MGNVKISLGIADAPAEIQIQLSYFRIWFRCINAKQPTVYPIRSVWRTKLTCILLCGGFAVHEWAGTSSVCSVLA